MSRWWLIDGFNALHAGWEERGSRAGWWRRERRERLIERVRSFDAGDAGVIVVFDGGSAETTEVRPRVVYAPSADEWIVRRVKGAGPDDETIVVTGDRSLADRCRHHGARIVSPRAFLASCER